MANQDYIQLFASCIPVKGASRSVICDLQRRTFEYIPLGLYEILTECKELKVFEIKEKYKDVNTEIIDEYLDWIIRKELGFYTDEPERFPPIDNVFETPEFINNAIIDIDENSQHNYESIYASLDRLACKFLELRSYYSLNYSQILEIVKASKNLRFRDISLYTKYNEELTKADIATLILESPALSRIVFHSAPEDKKFSPHPMRYVFFTTEIVDSEKCCGIIDISKFSINLDTYLESLQFNTCLNKKVSIDRFGNIKNCPSMTTSYGSVKSKKIEDVINNIEFQKPWFVKKDQIEVCKVCEFRYVCTDCRAYLDSDTSLGKPVKCNYNPFNGTWES